MYNPSHSPVRTSHLLAGHGNTGSLVDQSQTEILKNTQDTENIVQSFQIFPA